MSDVAFVAGLRPIPSGVVDPLGAWPAPDIIGVTPNGIPVEVRFEGCDRPVLLAFLHTHCDGCDEFWSGFGAAAEPPWPHSVSPAIVTRGPDSVAPSEVEEAGAGVVDVPVVMSDQAWVDYRVMGYPFFVLVDVGSRTVVGETVGFGWSDVVSMIRSAGC
jgi:hypothetical protein